MNKQIARALLGVLLAKAAIIGGWYLYQKVEKEANDEDKDLENKTEVPEVVVVKEEVAKPKKVRRPAAKKVAIKTTEAPAVKKVARKRAAKKAV